MTSWPQCVFWSVVAICATYLIAKIFCTGGGWP